MEKETRRPFTPDHTYNESLVPQTEQKHKGWHWDHETKEFYRWDNFPRRSD